MRKRQNVAPSQSRERRATGCPPSCRNVGISGPQKGPAVSPAGRVYPVASTAGARLYLEGEIDGTNFIEDLLQQLCDRWKRGSSVIRVTWAGRERNDATCHNRTHCTSTISCFTRSPCRLSKSACQISQRLTLLPNLARVIGFLFQPIDGFSDSFKLNFSGARYGIG